MNKRYLYVDLDDAARRLTNGHYVVQSAPGPVPTRDKMISEAIARMKANRPVKARQ